MQLSELKTAVITGGASGLGEATARRLARQGVKVALFDMNADRGMKIAAELGGVFCETDVTNEASVDASLAKSRSAIGVERLLVNCAGIAPPKRTISFKKDTGQYVAHDIATFAKVVQVNLIGTYLMISKCALGMVAEKPINEDGARGVIVSTASVAAEDGQIGQAAYGASKGGVKSLTLPVARDLAQFGIRVMSILPGMMWTPMFDGLPEEAQKSLAMQVPFPQRLGKADEYAMLVQHIVENDLLNGENIRLDGAIRMAPR